ncbi:hypothetical protein [Paenibacillus taiwanensis]|uniref:hypothetical protein n=1 Tax=Paenibacillus taiwanensis TaxID=401638 RepID=UPI00041CD738|nr:hypothetical protein [Paenibacillus taiwanensis]
MRSCSWQQWGGESIATVYETNELTRKLSGITQMSKGSARSPSGAALPLLC